MNFLQKQNFLRTINYSIGANLPYGDLMTAYYTAVDQLQSGAMTIYDFNAQWQPNY